MDLECFAKSKGYNLETVKTALRMAIEEVFRKMHAISAVDVSIESKTINVVYRVPCDISISKALILENSVIEGDVISAEFSLEHFPKTFANLTKIFFNDALMDLNNQDIYDKWKKKKHTVVEGEIMQNKKNLVSVLIDSETAIMPKNYWVNSEAHLYRTGNTLNFFIAKIEYNPLKIYVSRDSKRLPALMLKKQLPWFDFVCTNRFIGQKSTIKTNAVIDNKFKNIRDNVSKELNNEIIDIQPL